MEQCEGKMRYTSQHMAKKVRNVREKDVSHLRVYQCAKCFGWHLARDYKRRLKNDIAKGKRFRDRIT